MNKGTILKLMLVLAMAAVGCDGSDGTANGQTGGVVSSGGRTVTGGGTASGGTSAGGSATGGTTGSGGRLSTGGSGTIATGGSAAGGSAVGGSIAAGGAMSSGGAASTGGARSGGTVVSGGAAATGGALTGGTRAGGATGTGGTRTGGMTGGTTGGTTGGATGGAPGSGGSTTPTTGLPKFSFFVTSIEAMRELSGSQNGFGGDLRFGEATGLAGADKLCRTIAERSMAGSGAKGWAAFLSATTGGPNGGAVNAIDRVGTGPWYDRLGRTVALSKTDLAATRPGNCDAAICSDLPNENGVPNHQNVDNHDVLTGSNASGRLNATNAGATCNDWTSVVGSTGKPMCGHSWPAMSGQSWIQAHAAGGCAAGVNLVQTGGGFGTDTVGGGGGYGGIYCFALQP